MMWILTPTREERKIFHISAEGAIRTLEDDNRVLVDAGRIFFERRTVMSRSVTVMFALALRIWLSWLQTCVYFRHPSSSSVF
jgi:hypothetical protein